MASEAPLRRARDTPDPQQDEPAARGRTGHDAAAAANLDAPYHRAASARPSSTLLGSQDGRSVRTKDHDAQDAPQAGPKYRTSYTLPSTDSLCRDNNAAPAAPIQPIQPLSEKRQSPHQGNIATAAPVAPRSFWLRRRVLATIVAAIMLALTIILVVCLAFRAAAVCPVVETERGKYVGTPLPNGITQWLGIRYAAPPVGDNRFRAPQDPESFEGVRAATKTQPGCPGMVNMPAGTAEDCLFLDVYAPTMADSDAKLPVLAWIQGGGFSSAAGHTNGSMLIEAADKNLITVSMTYRAGAFGFLSSKEIKDGGHLNNGLRDQRAVLEWVQANIEEFGGDPKHVTVGGQSAGAGSVVQHLVANNGTDHGLFQAALLESQSMPPIRPYDAQQYQFDHLAEKTNCGGAADKLACLRGVPAADLLKAAVPEPFPDGAGGPPVFSYNPVVDGDFVTDLPAHAFAEGRFVRVPTVFGDVADEGTIFAPHSLKDETGARNFIKNNFPHLTDGELDECADRYAFDAAKPADPAAPGAYWHRAALAYGEVRYTCAGLYLSDMVAAHNDAKVWTYRYDVLDPASIPSGDNVSHGAELPAVWGVPPSGGPKSLLGEHKSVVPLVQGYWTSFLRHWDPNAGRAPGAPAWDAWTGNNRIHLTADDPGMENVTDGQLGRCNFWKGIAVDIMQ